MAVETVRSVFTLGAEECWRRVEYTEGGWWGWWGGGCEWWGWELVCIAVRLERKIVKGREEGTGLLLQCYI